MKLKLAFLATILSLQTFAQEQNTVEMADVMRSNGKIYVVITVLTVVFLGIVIYLINLDRKVTKLEKELKK